MSFLSSPRPRIQDRIQIFSQTGSFGINALKKQNGTGDLTNSAAEHLNSGPGSLTYQSYLTPMPQLPFYKMAMTILPPPKVVRRSDELIHAKDLEQCLEHSKCISCLYLNFLFLPPDILTSQISTPPLREAFLLLAQELKQPPDPSHFLKSFYLLHMALPWSEITLPVDVVMVDYLFSRAGAIACYGH